MQLWPVSRNLSIMLLLVGMASGCSMYDTSQEVTAPAISSLESSINVPSAAPSSDVAVNIAPPALKMDNREQARPEQSVAFIDGLYGYGIKRSNEAYELLQSENGGESWTVKHAFTERSVVYGLSFLNKYTGWLLAKSKKGAGIDLLLTSDGGDTWEIISSQIQDLGVSGELPFFRFFDRQNGMIALPSPTSLQILRSQDGGLTWTVSDNKQLPKGGGGVFTFVSPSKGWYAVQDAKRGLVALYQTTDGDRWTLSGSLKEGYKPAAIDFADTNNGWLLLHDPAAAKPWLLARTSNEGERWEERAFPASFAPDPDRLYMAATTDDHSWILAVNGLWRSLNGGLNWNQLTP